MLWFQLKAINNNNVLAFRFLLLANAISMLGLMFQLSRMLSKEVGANLCVGIIYPDFHTTRNQLK